MNISVFKKASWNLFKIALLLKAETKGYISTYRAAFSQGLKLALNFISVILGETNGEPKKRFQTSS